MSTLRKTIEDLAAQFTDGVLAALRNASLEDIYGVSGGGAGRGGARRGRPARAGAAAGAAPARRPGGRRGRRNADDIEQMVSEIVSLLGKNPDGLRAEQIRTALGVAAKELPRPLAEGLSSGRLQKTGQKRATTYTLGSGGGGGGGAKPTRRRGAGRKKRG